MSYYALRNAFDFSHQAAMIQQEFQKAAYEMQRPFVLIKPKMYRDGNMWCALYGDDLQSGVAAFGETPAKAATQFDVEWLNQKAQPTKD